MKAERCMTYIGILKTQEPKTYYVEEMREKESVCEVVAVFGVIAILPKHKICVHIVCM